MGNDRTVNAMDATPDKLYLAYVDAADDLYAAFVGFGNTPGQREALRNFAGASNGWPDHPRKGAAVTKSKS